MIPANLAMTVGPGRFNCDQHPFEFRKSEPKYDRPAAREVHITFRDLSDLGDLRQD